MLNQTKLQRRVEGKDLESVADRVALAHAKLLPARGVRWHANPPPEWKNARRKSAERNSVSRPVRQQPQEVQRVQSD